MMFVLAWLMTWVWVGGLHLPDSNGWAMALVACLTIECARVRRWYRSLP